MFSISRNNFALELTCRGFYRRSEKLAQYGVKPERLDRSGRTTEMTFYVFLHMCSCPGGNPINSFKLIIAQSQLCCIEVRKYLDLCGSWQLGYTHFKKKNRWWFIFKKKNNYRIV